MHSDFFELHSSSTWLASYLHACSEFCNNLKIPCTHAHAYTIYGKLTKTALKRIRPRADHVGNYVYIHVTVQCTGFVYVCASRFSFDSGVHELVCACVLLSRARARDKLERSFTMSAKQDQGECNCKGSDGCSSKQ